MGEEAGSKPRKAIFSFITPSTTVRASYSVQKRSFTKALQRHRWFDEGELLDTMEKGVMYPIIHYAEVCPNGNKPPMSLQDPAALGQEFKLQQGLYSEIKYSCPTTLKKISSSEDDLVSHKACIFMGFKKLDSHFSEVLEDSWKDWTGARIIYMSLSDEFGLSRLSFYRRVAPRDADMFMYIVMVECNSVTSKNQIRLLDFVQRLRVERMIGYLSVYNVERLVPSTANVINGLLTEAVDGEGKVNI
ncbi:uncharacterized protein CDAR_552101 [Caerostris darwini]|uniref:DUF7153 domain-containing protein n=1 Tax=Caerostris darwini TaxID=1538125 RepID=A0AAV4NKZ5_9ARAC|nr:uncharacterized protein CDAR_552101 [Caerostris darwini]